MKNFAYIQHHGLPSQKAHSVYIVKSAEATSKIYSNSYLVIPSFNKNSNKQIQDYYQLIKTKLKIVQLKTPDIRDLTIIPRIIQKHCWFLTSSWIFAFKSFLWAKKNKINIIQTGDRELIVLLKIFKFAFNPQVIYDVHFDFSVNKYDSFIEKIILSRVNLIAVNCLYLKNKFIKQGIDKSKLIVLSHGYDPGNYNKITKRQSREKYILPQNKFIVGYIGKFETLGIEKGIAILLKAAQTLKTSIPICIVAIGGPGHLVEKYKNLAKKLKLTKDEAIIMDYIPNHRVGEVIAGFDVCALLYPPIGYFVEKMSPMKAVEYQAAQKPIIATDIPSIREILNDEAFYPDKFNQESINSTIESIYNNKIHLKHYKYNKLLTWQQRQNTILNLL